ncbi:MAG: cadmium-translocating P-type ATPase [Clostridia bacterium]|nr:cadmium-translocating P-type ATPase [Clostridia bacterium]
MEKISLSLDGLGCASCASKIESRSKQLEGIENVVLDFSKSKLTLELHEGSKDELIRKITNIVNALEPDVKVEIQMPGSPPSNRPGVNIKYVHNRKELLRLGISLSLFTIGLIFKSAPYIQIGALITAYLLSGHKVLMRSFRNILRGDIFDENFLMSIATFGAIAIGEYPEAVAVMIFYEIGEYFQDLAVAKSKNAIGALMDIRPDIAVVRRDGFWTTVSPESIEKGEVLLVKPGERIPLDGTVANGTSTLDTSALTGESIPVTVTVGDQVLSGSVVQNGLLQIEATAVYSESTIARILDLVENATAHKAPTENFITKFARYYTPAVVFFAVFIATVPPFLLNMGTFEDWLYRSLIFLVISCPCALVVSVPLGFFSGIGNASHNGILIKGSNYLEALNSIDTVIFDKTGTLTEGVFEVSAVYPAEENKRDELFLSAKLAESHSNHPIAKSIVAYCDVEISENDILDYEELSGYGIRMTSKYGRILAGNEKLLKEHHIDVPIIQSAYSVVYIAKGNKYLGAFDIRDRIKTDAKMTIDAMKGSNIHTVMLTGDRKASADEVGDLLGIDEIYSQLLPEDKYNKVMSLISAGGKVAFIGDGINDAPVLAGATVGISMGAIGSDAAIEASDVVFMTDEPSKLIHAIQISKRTKQIVTQNIIFALGTKFLIMGLGIFGLSSMWMAIFADVGVALIAVMNSVRILHFKSSAN